MKSKDVIVYGNLLKTAKYLVPSNVLAEAILTFPRLVVNMQTLFKSMVTLVKVCIVWLHLMTMDNIKLY